MRYSVMLLGLAVPVLLVAQHPERPLPRFRAGANLVTVDAYVSRGEMPLTDLTVDDFTLYEDDKPQRVENFELIRAREAVPSNERRDPNNTREMRQQVTGAARVFTLFFDPLYVSVSGSYYLQKPLVETLDKVIGPDDMVGAMTPDMSPSAITYSKRTESIERFVTKHWMWGNRDVRWPVVGRPEEGRAEEAAIWDCYPPPAEENRGIATVMIARLREARTLNALRSLVVHLEGLRQDRKFVMIFTEGWRLHGRDPSLSRVLEGGGPRPDPLTADPATGRIRPQGSGDPERGAVMTKNACEQLRLQLSQVDHERDFLALLQRANRANVSFYPVDARGLLVFDQPTNFDLAPSDDQAILRRRHDFLKDMAAQTDGHAVLNTGHVTEGLTKIFRDVGSYYLMSYYSTNQKLDGKFRRIRVEVKRPGADVRARPGYLAPTEAEARAVDAAIERGLANTPSPTVTRALDALTPARDALPVRVQAVGARGAIRAVVELDVATAKQPEWAGGGTARLSFLAEDGSAAPATVSVALGVGQRTLTIETGGVPMVEGRYRVRAEVMPGTAQTGPAATTTAIVPARDAVAGSGALAYRRGPSTGLAYMPTADARFRRTERLRVEVPIETDGVTGSGRVLTREGQPMPLAVSYASRRDEKTGQVFGVAEVILSPLAVAEYVLELSFSGKGRTDAVGYGFRIIP